MIQLLFPSDPAESLASSLFYIMVASICLLWGKSLFAVGCACIVIYVLYEQAHISTRLSKWLVISFLTLAVSGGSWVLFFLASTHDDKDHASKSWYFGFALQKVGGLVFGYLVYDEAYAKPLQQQRQQQRYDMQQQSPSNNSHGTSRSISPTPSSIPRAARPSLTRRDSLVKTVRLEVRIKEGQGLVAKDKNIFGQKTKSDPYIKIYLGSIRTHLGTTKVKSKTLDPVWEQTFKRTILARSLSDYKHIICHIFDHDKMSKDDPMGTVIIPLPTMDDLKLVNWYDVEPGEGNMLCENASGRVLVEVEIQS